MKFDYTINVMGGLSISEKVGDIISFSSRKSEAIITYVIFSEKTSCEREELATLFWEDMPEKNALTNLRVTLANIRKAVPDLLNISRRRVMLNPNVRISVDGIQLFQLLDELNVHRRMKEAISLEKAKEVADKLVLYKGSFLKGFYIRSAIAFEDWIMFKREMLKTGAIEAMQLALDVFNRNGENAAGIALANLMLFIAPFNAAA